MTAAALTIGVGAVVFIVYFHVTYWLCVDWAHLYYLHVSETTYTAPNPNNFSIAALGNPFSPQGRHYRGCFDSHILGALDGYGVGRWYGSSWTWPEGRRVHSPPNAIAITSILPLGCLGVILALVWWRRIARSNIEPDRLRYCSRVVRRSAPYIYMAMATSGLAAGGLIVLVRFLQVLCDPDFNRSTNTIIEYDRDWYGLGIASLSTLTAVTLISLSIVYPRVKRRVLAEMGRCGHCGYPREGDRPCSECGFSPPARAR